MSKLREIPRSRNLPGELEKVIGPVSEYTQHIRGRRESRIEPIKGTPTLNDVANKVNEIIERLQE